MGGILAIGLSLFFACIFISLIHIRTSSIGEIREHGQLILTSNLILGFSFANVEEIKLNREGLLMAPEIYLPHSDLYMEFSKHLSDFCKNHN